MATVIVGTLADGQLAGSKATIHTCPAGKQQHVHVVLANTSSATPYTFNLYVKRSGGTSRRIAGAATALAASARFEFPTHAIGLKLSAGDLIEGDASVAAVVDFLVHGGTEAAP